MPKLIIVSCFVFFLRFPSKKNRLYVSLLIFYEFKMNFCRLVMMQIDFTPLRMHDHTEIFWTKIWGKTVHCLSAVVASETAQYSFLRKFSEIFGYREIKRTNIGNVCLSGCSWLRHCLPAFVHSWDSQSTFVLTSFCSAASHLLHI